MRNGRILGVVPARLRSERLPGKPLLDLGGRPLIEWVWRRVSAFGTLDSCVVATDAEEVARTCREFGAAVVMTSPDHRSGTDRVAEVMTLEDYAGYDLAVNVQGDEPLVEEAHVAAALDQVRRGYDIGTVATPLRDVSAWLDPAVVKVTRRSNGAALYFSRAPIPFRRDRQPDEAELASSRFLRHVGVYAFTRHALQMWAELPADPLEQIEQLEQLRPLGSGLTIGVGIVAAAEGGVDTPADVIRVLDRLKDIQTELSSSPEAEQ